MSILSRLFGGGKSKPATPPEEHAGCRIYPEPRQEAGGYRIAARIEKDIDGQTKVHQMIRADVCQSRDEAVTTALGKARLLIDQQGEAIFR